MPKNKLPNNVKKLRGTAQPCRMVKDVPEFESLTDITAPAWLSPLAQEYWNRITPILRGKNILTEADLESLEIMCMLYGDFRQKAIAGVDISGALIGQLRGYQGEFGLTPVSRMKLGKPEDGKPRNRFSNNGKPRT